MDNLNTPDNMSKNTHTKLFKLWFSGASGNDCIPEKAQSYQGFFAMSARCGNKMTTLFELLR